MSSMSILSYQSILTLLTNKLRWFHITEDAMQLKMEENMQEIKLKEEFIKLGQALKVGNMVEDGVEAKYVIQDGLVTVNGETDLRRGRKLYEGDVVSYKGDVIKIVK